jgi:hypothetical protein
MVCVEVVMTKDCIQDFIQVWQHWDKNQSKRGLAWHVRFRDAGYYSIQPSHDSIGINWQKMHKWCEEHFGRDHYAWTGSTFWFENDKDAGLFALRWA